MRLLDRNNMTAIQVANDKDEDCEKREVGSTNQVIYQRN